MRSSNRRKKISIGLLVAGLVVAAAALAWGLSGSSHGPGPLGCVGSEWEIGQDTLEGTCERGRALKIPDSVAVSPDGRNVYVTSIQSNAVAVLDRDPKDRVLTQPSGPSGCVSASGTNGTCQKGRALREPNDVAVSPDGRNVYVTGQRAEGAIAIFDRDPETGALTQRPGVSGCLSQSGEGGCRARSGLFFPTALVFSPDGRNLYVVSAGTQAIDIFDRDPSTGDLTQKPGRAGCVSEPRFASASCRKGSGLGLVYDLVVSPDGRNLYAVSGKPGITIFDRDPETGALRQIPRTCISTGGAHGACARAGGFPETEGIAISPDGASVYVASGTISPSSTESNAVTIFDRDRRTGELTQKQAGAGCISTDGPPASCRKGRGLQGAGSLVVSPDGKNVYVSGEYSNGLATFDRRQGSGALTQKPGAAGCISDYEEEDCLRSVQLLGLPTDLAASPDGKEVYVVSPIFEGLVLTFDRSRTTGLLSTRVRGINGNE